MQEECETSCLPPFQIRFPQHARSQHHAMPFGISPKHQLGAIERSVFPRRAMPVMPRISGRCIKRQMKPTISGSKPNACGAGLWHHAAKLACCAATVLCANARSVAHDTCPCVLCLLHTFPITVGVCCWVTHSVIFKTPLTRRASSPRRVFSCLIMIAHAASRVLSAQASGQHQTSCGFTALLQPRDDINHPIADTSAHKPDRLRSFAAMTRNFDPLQDTPSSAASCFEVISWSSAIAALCSTARICPVRTSKLKRL